MQTPPAAHFRRCLKNIIENIKSNQKNPLKILNIFKNFGKELLILLLDDVNEYEAK